MLTDVIFSDSDFIALLLLYYFIGVEFVMKRKIVITSLILVIVPSILFAILYGIMSYVIYNTGEDYKEEIKGEWTGVQYLSNKQLFLCDESNNISLKFEDEKIYIDGTVMQPGEYSYKWNTGSIAKVDYMGEDCIFVISINSIDQLKVTINSMNYIITFDRIDKNAK